MVRFALPLLLAMSLLPAADQQQRVFVGVITDTMCGLDHASMKAGSDSQCVRECVSLHGSKYALAVGKELYPLHDQRTPEKYAGQKVQVTGVLYPKTKILKFKTMETTR